MFGVSIALSTTQNNTNVTWSLGGSTSTPGTPTSTSTSLPTSLLPGAGGSSNAAGGSFEVYKRAVAVWVGTVVVGYVFVVL